MWLLQGTRPENSMNKFSYLKLVKLDMGINVSMMELRTVMLIAMKKLWSVRQETAVSI